MKLATQISIIVVLGLAIHGLTQNGKGLGRQYSDRCDCCGKPRMEIPRTHSTSESVIESGMSFLVPPQEAVRSPEKITESTMPKPEAGAGSQSTAVESALAPVVQDILEVRRRLGGSSIASILESDSESPESEVSQAMLFQQAISEYAEKTSYEQVIEKAESGASENQRPVVNKTGHSVPDFVSWLHRFRF
jgi:hypothetical protein